MHGRAGAKGRIRDLEHVRDEAINRPDEILLRDGRLSKAAHVEAGYRVARGDDTDPVGEHIEVGRNPVMEDDRAAPAVLSFSPRRTDVVDNVVEAGICEGHEVFDQTQTRRVD